MLDSMIVVGRENLLLSLVVLVSFLLIFFILGVMMGNVTTMRILVKWGIPVFSGKLVKDYRLLKSVNKDGLGWLHIPNTCYTPIMADKVGYYKNRSFTKHGNHRGEIFLTDNRVSTTLRAIGNPSDNTFYDLATLEGSLTVRTHNVRDARFTFLKKYVNTDLQKNFPTISLYDNGKVRFFNFLFAVEMSLEDKKTLKYSDRANFLQRMREIAYLDSGRPSDNDVLILSGKTDIDTMLVFLVEKTEGFTNVKKKK